MRVNVYANEMVEKQTRSEIVEKDGRKGLRLHLSPTDAITLWDLDSARILLGTALSRLDEDEREIWLQEECDRLLSTGKISYCPHCGLCAETIKDMKHLSTCACYNKPYRGPLADPLGFQRCLTCRELIPLSQVATHSCTLQTLEDNF